MSLGHTTINPLEADVADADAQTVGSGRFIRVNVRCA
jgi:hypothetical protein